MLTDFRGKHDWKIAISSICQFEIFFSVLATLPPLSVPWKAVGTPLCLPGVASWSQGEQ